MSVAHPPPPLGRGRRINSQLFIILFGVARKRICTARRCPRCVRVVLAAKRTSLRWEQARHSVILAASPGPFAGGTGRTVLRASCCARQLGQERRAPQRAQDRKGYRRKYRDRRPQRTSRTLPRAATSVPARLSGATRDTLTQRGSCHGGSVRGAHWTWRSAAAEPQTRAHGRWAFRAVRLRRRRPGVPRRPSAKAQRLRGRPVHAHAPALGRRPACPTGGDPGVRMLPS